MCCLAWLVVAAAVTGAASLAEEDEATAGALNWAFAPEELVMGCGMVSSQKAHVVLAEEAGIGGLA